MPKYKVYVERLVPQHTTVVVEAASDAEIREHRNEIFDSACMFDSWEYADDAESANKLSNIGITLCYPEDLADLRIVPARVEQVLPSEGDSE